MIRWWIWLGYNAIWTILLVLPASGFAPLGLDEVPAFRMIVSKTSHVLAYALFAWLSGWVMVPARYRWMMLFFLMAHATVTELIQLKLPFLGRTGRLEDVGLDHLGILIGLAAGWKWWSDPR